MSRKPTPLTDELRHYLLRVGTREDAVLQELRERTALLPGRDMQISAEQGQLLRFLIETLGARSCLEVGVFTGYSALCTALAMPDDGKLVALDVDAETTAVAREFFERAGVGHKLDLRIGPASQSLAELLEAKAEFDFAFIDADKESLEVYYRDCLALLRPGGVMAIDNVLWNGSVIEADNRRPATIAVRQLNERVHADERVALTMVPIGDGLTLLRKR